MTPTKPRGLGRGAAPPDTPFCPSAPHTEILRSLCPRGPQDRTLLLPWKGEARPAVLEAGLQAERFLKI